MFEERCAEVLAEAVLPASAGVVALAFGEPRFAARPVVLELSGCVQPRPGTFVWTTPTGHQCTVQPPDVLDPD